MKTNRLLRDRTVRPAQTADRPADTDRYHYSGDVNLEHGGAFIDLSTFAHGYCSAVIVTDLDSACGFAGAVMVEHVVINGTDNPERIRAALACQGGSHARGARKGQWSKEALRHMIAEALCAYGYRDPDDSWDGYASYHTEIILTDPTAPRTFEGWTADKVISGNLAAYVRAVHLQD